MALRIDTQVMRKSRGAFFTPPPIARFISEWAVRHRDDIVLEPSCGDAVFLREAGRSLSTLGANLADQDQLVGYDIHQDSLDDAAEILQSEGFRAQLIAQDFFEVEPTGTASAVVGNPPYIRFQGFGGRSRELSIERAARVGVEMSGLASSWAAFVIHGSTFLRHGGRLGLVLPAELLSVNYAAPIRRFLLENFSSIDLIVFDELVFDGVQADVVVLLAEGYKLGAARYFRVHTAKNATSIHIKGGSAWAPTNLSDRWTDALAPNDAAQELNALPTGLLEPLESWGRVTSGIVTGANSYFTMTRGQATDLSLRTAELVPLLPAGHSLANHAGVTRHQWRQYAGPERGVLFRPSGKPSPAARRYIELGEDLGIDLHYKCKVRTPWWRVPIGGRPDFFVSYMSAATPRIVRNDANLLNLNSIHGLRVDPALQQLASAYLPVLSMNSASLLSAELVGRSYGGGVLKLEPREASQWMIPSPRTLAQLGPSVLSLVARGRRLLAAGNVEGCIAIADEVLLLADERTTVSKDQLYRLREARLEMVARRATRGSSRSKTEMLANDEQT